jgi:hypothetical protein
MPSGVEEHSESSAAGLEFGQHGTDTQKVLLGLVEVIDREVQVHSARGAGH